MKQNKVSTSASRPTTRVYAPVQSDKPELTTEGLARL